MLKSHIAFPIETLHILLNTDFYLTAAEQFMYLDEGSTINKRKNIH